MYIVLIKMNNMYYYGVNPFSGKHEFGKDITQAKIFKSKNEGEKILEKLPSDAYLIKKICKIA